MEYSIQEEVIFHTEEEVLHNGYNYSIRNIYFIYCWRCNSAGASPGTVSIPAIPLDKTVISSADGTQTSTTVYENFSIASLTKNKQTARGFTNSTRYGQIFPRTVYGN